LQEIQSVAKEGRQAIIVEHDLEFLNASATATIVLKQGFGERSPFWGFIPNIRVKAESAKSQSLSVIPNTSTVFEAYPYI
jgi:ABC-type histidine transport system ATPase subunit